MNFKRNRREVILGVGASLLAAGSVSGEIEAQSVATSIPKPGIYPGGSETYASLLNQFYPTLAADSGFRALSPACYIVQNRASLGIRALAMTWSVATGASIFNYPMHLELPPNHHSSRTGQRLLMGRDAVILVSPFFSWHPAAVPRLPIRWSSILAGTAARKFLAIELLASKAFGFHYDGAIFANGHVAGPATKHLAKQALLIQAGEHDCALSINKLLKSGSSLSEISQVLTGYCRWHPRIPPTTHARIYQAAARTHAAVLLRILKKSPDSFVNIVESNSGQQRLVLS